MSLSERERWILLCGSIVGALGLMALGKARVSTPCVKALAKIEATEGFCKGLADRAIEDNCSEFNGLQHSQCHRLVSQLAKDACYGLVQMDDQKVQASKVCS